MPRRAVKGARAKRTESPTPVSSAPALAYNLEGEFDVQDANSLSISALALDVPIASQQCAQEKEKSFRFMELPSELRVKIFKFHFADVGPVVDLEPGNYWSIHKRLSILRVCRLFHREASDAFYSSKTFRIFPVDGRYSRAKKGLLARLKPQCRAHIMSLELRLGPGFNTPYRSWAVNGLLGLQDCVKVKNLSVFVEIDPSDRIFNGWRRSSGFYENFSRQLLDGVLQGLPQADTVQFDAYRSVKRGGDMMKALLDVAHKNKRTITWGPERGWTDDKQSEIDYDPPVRPTAAIDWGLPTHHTVMALAPQRVLVQGIKVK